MCVCIYSYVCYICVVYICFRAQTVVLIDKDNHVTYMERTLVPREGEHHANTKSLEFDLLMRS